MPKKSRKPSPNAQDGYARLEIDINKCVVDESVEDGVIAPKVDGSFHLNKRELMKLYRKQWKAKKGGVK